MADYTIKEENPAPSPTPEEFQLYDNGTAGQVYTIYNVQYKGNNGNPPEHYTAGTAINIGSSGDPDWYVLFPRETTSCEGSPPAGQKKGKVVGTSGSCNKAKAADPGMHLMLDFTQFNPPEFVHKVIALINISIPEDKDDRGMTFENEGTKYQHHMQYTMDGNGQALDLSKPITVVIPFVDKDWVIEGHHKLDFKYRISVYFNTDGGHQEGQTHALQKEGKWHNYIEGEISGDDTPAGPFICGYKKSAVPHSMPWRYEANGVILENIIYTDDGVWFQVHYPGNRPTPTYLFRTDTYANSNLNPEPSDYQNHEVDEFESCYLPYPRLKDSPPDPHKVIITVDTFEETGEIDEHGRKKMRRVRNNFHPPSEFQPYTDLFTIKGHDKPRAKVLKDDYSQSYSPDHHSQSDSPPKAEPIPENTPPPKEELGFMDRLQKAFRILIGSED